MEREGDEKKRPGDPQGAGSAGRKVRRTVATTEPARCRLQARLRNATNAKESRGVRIDGVGEGVKGFVATWALRRVLSGPQQFHEPKSMPAIATSCEDQKIDIHFIISDRNSPNFF